MALDREAERLEPIERGGLGLDRGAAIGAVLDEDVRPGSEIAAGGDRGVDLAQRTGAGVARVGIQRQAGLLALGVDARELGLRHVDLAPGLERDRFAQPLRDGLDRAQVGRHVLAGRAVAPRRTLYEAATLVAQGDGQAVDLELGDVAQLQGGLGRRGQLEALAHAGVERPQLIVVEGVAEAQHRCPMADLVEGRRRRATDALGGRIGRRQLWMVGLELLELAHQRVPLGVADLRRVLFVVEPVGALDPLAQVGDAGGRIVGRVGHESRIPNLQPAASVREGRIRRRVSERPLDG